MAIGTLAVWSYTNSLKEAKITAQSTEELNSSLSDTPNTPDRIKETLGWYFSKYGGNFYQLYKVIECESNFNNDLIGKAGEIGLAQFMPSSWKYFNKLRGTDLDIHKINDQLNMFVWAMNNNLERHWTCFRILK